MNFKSLSSYIPDKVATTGIAMIQCVLLLTLSMLLYVLISYPSEPNPPCWWTVFTFSKYSLGKSYERSGSTQQCRYGVIYWMTNNVDIAKHWHLLIKYSQLFTKSSQLQYYQAVTQLEHTTLPIQHSHNILFKIEYFMHSRSVTDTLWNTIVTGSE